MAYAKNLLKHKETRSVRERDEGMNQRASRGHTTRYLYTDCGFVNQQLHKPMSLHSSLVLTTFFTLKGI